MSGLKPNGATYGLAMEVVMNHGLHWYEMFWALSLYVGNLLKKYIFVLKAESIRSRTYVKRPFL